MPWRRHHVDGELAPLLEAFHERHRRADTQRIEQAFDVAREAHAEQVRRSGEPYIAHPLGVAMILARSNPAGRGSSATPSGSAMGLSRAPDLLGVRLPGDIEEGLLDALGVGSAVALVERLREQRHELAVDMVAAPGDGRPERRSGRSSIEVM